MRARYPGVEGFVGRDGLRLGSEAFGDGDPTILLLPSWTIIHSRFWKMQVPYLSRHYRVVTFDGPGNGRSDRTVDPDRYAVDSYVDDAVEILDVCGVERAVVVGLSRGAQYGLRHAALHRPGCAGLVMYRGGLALGLPAAGRERIEETFWQPYPQPPKGWDKYNLAYWHDHYREVSPRVLLRGGLRRAPLHQALRGHGGLGARDRARRSSRRTRGAHCSV